MLIHELCQRKVDKLVFYGPNMVMTHRTQYRNAIVTPYTDGDPGSSEVDSEGASWVDWILTKKLLTILRCDDCLSR